MKKGEVIKLEIGKYAFEGRGIAKLNIPVENKENFVVFTDGAYPGDVVNASLTKIKKNYAEAKVVDILVPSPYRVKPNCKYFGICGGCKQQDFSYEKQIEYKQLQVNEIFQKMGGLSDYICQPIVPSKNIFFYRNKMEFSFADKRWLTEEEIKSEKIFERSFALGLHTPNSFDKVLDIDGCFLQSEISNNILKFTKDFFKSRNSSIYTTKTHTGYLRNLVIKQSFNTNDLMVNLVTSAEDDELINTYCNQLLKTVPQVTTIINNINTKKALVATGDYEKIFYGSGFIYDSIGHCKFRISANSFFQTNTAQAENLYNIALDYSELTGNEIVYDLYSGAGTISIFISSKAKEVHGFEVVEPAVNDAITNKGINNTENVFFHLTDLYNSFLPYINENKIPPADVIILDPPRNGLHINTVNDVIALSPKKIVYVSCNPATQVRDIKFFTDAGYKLLKINPVDMFPHTYHIENVALLKKL